MNADKIAAEVFESINGYEYNPKKADNLDRAVFHTALSAAQRTMNLVLAGMEREDRSERRRGGIEALSNLAQSVRDEFGSQGMLCPWVGALDDEIARLEQEERS